MAVRRADLGPASAWAEAVAEGYTGTREDWARALASASTAAQRVEDAAEIVARAVDVDTALAQVDAGLQMVTTWTTGAQMINPAGVVSGKLNAAGTAVGADSVFETTGWIPVQALQEYKVGRWGSGRWGTGTDYVNRWAAYSARDLSAVIGAASSTACTEFTTPEGAAFVRFSYKATYTGLLMAPAESFPEEWEDYGRQYSYAAGIATQEELDAEEAAREASEQLIYDGIANAVYAEQVAREAADQSLSSDLADEASARQTADGLLSAALSATADRLDGSAGAVSVTTWAELVAAFTAGGVYALTADITYSSEVGKIESGADVTLYGRGHRVNLGDVSTPITLGGTVHLFDVELYHAQGNMILTEGGALFMRGCLLRAVRGTGSRFIRGQGVARIHIEDCELYGCLGDDGFSLDGNAAGYVRRCKIHACYDEGLSTHGDSFCVVEDCEAWDNGYTVYIGNMQTDYEITVDKSSIGAASSYGGIHIGGSRMGTVRGCYSHDNATYGIGLYCLTAGSRAGKAICEGNLASHNGFVNSAAGTSNTCGGIIVAGVKDCEVRSNTCVANAGYGMRFGLDGIRPYIASDFASAGFVAGNIISGNVENTLTVDAGANGGLHIDADKTLAEIVKVDQSLSVEGVAADAKAVGDALGMLDTDLAHADSIAPVQGSTASANITAGALLMQDGKLYQATQAIVSGAEIVPGTNAQATTIATMFAPTLVSGAITSVSQEYAVFGATDSRTYVYPFGLAVAKFYFRIASNPGTTERTIATTTVKPLVQVGMTVTSQEGTYCAVFITTAGNIRINTKASDANGTYHVEIVYPIAPHITT